MSVLPWVLVAFLTAGWLATILLLAFTRGERDGAEEELERLVRENTTLRNLLEA